jgi:phosphocarrier protein HPr
LKKVDDIKNLCSYFDKLVQNIIDGCMEICYSKVREGLTLSHRGVKGMYMKEVAVNNQVGLHARPATFFIQKANEYKSSIWVEKEERRVNAKSLLGVLSLGIVRGTEVTLIADGPDETEAVEALMELISTNFSE